MRARILSAEVPAMSTIGYGVAELEDGRRVRFVGDHGPMRRIVEALEDDEEVTTADLEDWQITSQLAVEDGDPQ